MRVAGTRKLSCCSWHFMQSHKMTKQKIHVDEFAGKLCVATNHQVFSVYSQILHHVEAARKICVRLFFFRQDEYDFTTSNNISQCFRIVAHLIATTCAIDMNEQKHSPSKSGPYAVFAVPVWFECVVIFSSQHLSVSRNTEVSASRWSAPGIRANKIEAKQILKIRTRTGSLRLEIKGEIHVAFSIRTHPTMIWIELVRCRGIVCAALMCALASLSSQEDERGKYERTHWWP